MVSDFSFSYWIWDTNKIIFFNKAYCTAYWNRCCYRNNIWWKHDCVLLSFFTANNSSCGNLCIVNFSGKISTMVFSDWNNLKYNWNIHNVKTQEKNERRNEKWIKE